MDNKNLYFILSGSCKLVRGLKRSVIIDYDRGDLYFISHEYIELIEKMDRQRLDDIEREIDEESKGFFEEFLAIISKYEIGFLTECPENFPRISDEAPADEYISILDVIIEIDENFYVKKQFEDLCKNLSENRCKDFQIRLLSKFNSILLAEVVEIINTTNANYIEIHCSYHENLDIKLLQDFVEAQPLVSNIYIYGSPEIKIVDVINDNPVYYSISLGKIYFINYPFEDGHCCGIINQENLNYTSFNLHNQLKTRNGCLDRKISIDRYGNIKNCPSMKKEFGNIRDISIKDVIQMESFKKYWFINKDQISICKVCEFRYNCTDCRAFLQDPDDIYSKPLKCGYDPGTCKWEDWSTNPLKERDNMHTENMIL